MNYFTPGQTYIFRSQINESQTNVISVVFDAGGNATIAITNDSVMPGDKAADYFFGPGDEFQFDEQANTILVTGDLSKYWYIYFNSPGHRSDNATVVGGPNVTVTCDCKKGDGSSSCEVSWTLQNDMLCASCVVKAGCEECKDPKWSSVAPTPTTSVMLKAETIIIS